MTDEQEKLVLNNENLIYHILKKYNLSVDEYYEVGVIGLCKAAISYNSNFGFTFSTYACKCIENGVKLEFRNQSKRIHPDMLIYIDEVDEENNTYLQIPCPKSNVENNAIAEMYIQKIIDTMNDRDKIIIQMIFDGFTQTEIASEMSMSRGNVSRIFRKFKSKINS